MRYRVLLLVLMGFLTLAGHSDEFYVVPVYARTLRGVDGEWSSYFLLTNPTAETVSLKLGETFGRTISGYCRFPEYSLDFPTTLGPHQTRLLCLPFESFGAFTFTSSRPLITDFKVYFTRPTATSYTQTFQHIEPGRAWVPAGIEATIYGARNAKGIARSNLLVVNPNTRVLTVSYTTARTAIDPPSSFAYVPVQAEVKVAPKSIAIVPLREAPHRECGVPIPVPCSSAAEQNVTLTGDLEFYVSASSIESDDAMFLSPVFTQP